MNALAPIRPEDPSELGYPPTLPIEIALRVAPLPDICAAYGISKEQFEELRRDPVFLGDLKRAVEMVKKEGMSFKLKAQLQADELLKTSWKMIHDQSGDVPPSVKADLLKFTVRAAGLDGSKDPSASANAGPSLSIQINL
jgi:hypothetical protein